MSLKEKLLDAAAPVIFFEVVPPAAGGSESVNAVIAQVARVRPLVDAVNLPEIHDEGRGTTRTHKFVPRVESRLLAAAIQRAHGLEAVINRVVVHDANPVVWLRTTYEEFGIRHLILVGGESSRIQYPGPGVLETARLVQELELPYCLGGITIPSRVQEAERIRRKHAAGLVLFTTQVLFDSNDIVWLIQRLNGLEARVFLSFAPVTQRRDIEFLRWLGADIPADRDRFLLAGDGSSAASETRLERSLNLAQRILLDVFDNLPPDPPLLGLNVEHINQRNFGPALTMLGRLGDLYANLIAARTRTSLA